MKVYYMKVFKKILRVTFAVLFFLSLITIFTGFYDGSMAGRFI